MKTTNTNTNIYFESFEDSVKNHSKRFVILKNKYTYSIYDTEQGAIHSAWICEVCECQEFEHALKIVFFLNDNTSLI